MFKEDMTLSCTGGKTLDLNDLRDLNFVLYFYPKDNTSACTLEAIGFSERYDEFRAQGFHVFGVSKDTLSVHEKFKEKHALKFDLISDVDKILLEAFEVIKDKKMYGKWVKGTERSTFVFKEGLELIKVFRDVKAATHPQEVLDFIQDLVWSKK